MFAGHRETVSKSIARGLGSCSFGQGLRLGLVLALVCSAAGCRTTCREYLQNHFKVGPNYEPPCAAVADEWIDYRDPRVISQPPADWAWWRVFNDPVLDQLVQRAYGQNLTLREAGFRVLEARALRAIAVGNFFPQSQSLFGSYDRQQLSLETLQGMATAGLQPRSFSTWTFGGQLAWELDFWGRFRRAIEAADADLDASVENYDDVIVLLIADVASAYVEIRTTEQRIRYAQGNVKSQTGSKELVDAKRQEGAASQLDVAQAVANVAQTEANIPGFEVQLRQAQNRLCVLLGIPPQDLTQLLAQVESRIPTAPPSVAVGIPADLIRRRPDLRRAERLVAAQSARIGIAESDLYPAFTINGSIFVQANQFQNLFRGSAVGGNVGPSFNWNVLNYGRLVAAVDFEEARYWALVSQYQNEVLNANREAEDGIVGFLRFQEQAEVLRIGVSAADESRILVNELYRGGRADFGRVFVAELFLTQQQDALAVAEGSVAQSLVEIYRSLGGGWQIRLGAPAGEVMAIGEPIPAVAPPQPTEAVPPPLDEPPIVPMQ